MGINNIEPVSLQGRIAVGSVEPNQVINLPNNFHDVPESAPDFVSRGAQKPRKTYGEEVLGNRGTTRSRGA